MTHRISGRRDTAEVLRWSLVGLAALAVAGTAVELATLRHWNGGLQLVPWVGVAVLTALAALLAVRPGRMAVRVVRVGAAAVLALSAFGVLQHVRANYDTAPLDRDYGPRWDAMSEAARWWAAATGGVGPAPSLAAGVLAQAALCLLLATLRHPALARDPAPERRGRGPRPERVSGG
ncbi:MAG: hypothetical protein AB1416_10145 [Actinomycetota bacterium]